MSSNMKDSNSQKVSEISDLAGYICQINKTAEGENLYLYRGQGDEKWSLDCSAIRRLKQNNYSEHNELLDYLFVGYLHQIIDEIKLSYPSIYRDLSALECMANLQHNGVATGLIDFTFNPLVALWFACDGEKDKDGKVFVVENNSEQIEEIKTTETLKGNLDQFFNTALDVKKKWHLWTPTLDSHKLSIQRMTMQQSAFLLGRTEIDTTMIKKEIVIPSKIKGDILKELKKWGFQKRHCFQILTGFIK